MVFTSRTMKRTLLLLLTCLSCVCADGQGTVFFENGFPGTSFDAPVYQSDRVTALSGSQFMAELFGGPTANSLTFIATTGFLTGTGAGYFNAGTQTINSVAPGTTAWVQVRVWNTSSGNSFLQAQASDLQDSWWTSAAFSVVTGGNTGISVLPPGNLTGLGNSPVYFNAIPEPSTFALAGVDAIVMLSRIRRRDRLAVSNR